MTPAITGKSSDDDLRGQKFGRLTIGRRAPSLTTNANRRFYCLCDCGNKPIVAFSSIKSGKIVSCGCFAAEQTRERVTTHGHTRGRRPTREYRTWTQMINRCENERNNAYSRYGARGITVCDRWRHSFENFLADMGERPPGTSIDRYPDRGGNYEPGNCRWATPQEQNRNTSTNKLTNADVVAIRVRLSAGDTASAIARDFGVTRSHVSGIKSGRAWK